MMLHYYGITDDTPDEMTAKFYESFKPEWRREAYPGSDAQLKQNTGPDRLTYGENLKAFAEKEYRLPPKYITHKEGNSGMTLEQAREYIARGHPVWVSFGPLQDLEARNKGITGKGHIAVIRGFTKDGDVILNDPWGDPADAMGRIKAAGVSNYRGFYEYGIGNGDNAVIKSGDFAQIIYPKLNQALVIEYPHMWSFPVRAGSDPARPFLFSTHVSPGDGVEWTAGLRREHRLKQVEAMLKTEGIDQACYPATGAGRWHDGIHINKRVGTPVYAAGPGRLVVVKAAETDAPSGRTSTCFALVKHQLPFGGGEFFSLSMHLQPEDIAGRLRKQFSFNEYIETSDWLDQIIQHIMPKRLIVRVPGESGDSPKKLDGVMDGHMPIVYPLSTPETIESKLGQRELIYLCPVANETYQKLFTINPETENVRSIRELYKELNDINSYKTNDHDPQYCIFYRINAGKGKIIWSKRYIRIADLRPEAGLVIQEINLKEFAYYRLKLAALMRGEAAAFCDEDTDTYEMDQGAATKSYKDIFTEKTEELFPAIKFQENTYLERYTDVRNYYMARRNAALGALPRYPDNAARTEYLRAVYDNLIEDITERLDALAEGLISYPRYMTTVGDEFKTKSGGNDQRWFTGLKNTYKSLITECNNENRYNPDELVKTLEQKIQDYEQYYTPKNVDYHIEVNNLTMIGKTEAAGDLHFGIFSDSCLIPAGDTTGKYRGNNDEFVLIDDSTGKDRYFNQHHIVALMKEANYFTERDFINRNPERLVITERALKTRYVGNKAMFQTAVVTRLNSYAALSEDEWIDLIKEGNGTWQNANPDRAEIRLRYLRYKFLTPEIIEKIAPEQNQNLKNAGGVFSTFYHPVRFLAWLDQRANGDPTSAMGVFQAMERSR
jgi:hypothetical protein